jgi:3-hydroxypropanoate dehydrogenase
VSAPLPQPALDQLFNEARSFSHWLPEPVPEATLRELHRLALLAPTAMNCQPLRVVFLASAEARERLVSALAPGNVEKVRSAPVVAILALDSQFYELMPQVWHGAGARDSIAANADSAAAMALRNATLGAAYFIVAARSLGLDCGPMGGFSAAKADAEFFPDGRWKSNILCALGHGDRSRLHPRNPRLSFEQAAMVL